MSKTEYKNRKKIGLKAQKDGKIEQKNKYNVKNIIRSTCSNNQQNRNKKTRGFKKNNSKNLVD